MISARPVLMLLPLFAFAPGCEKTNPPKPGIPHHETTGNTNTLPSAGGESASGGVVARVVSVDAAAGTLTVAWIDGAEPQTLQVDPAARVGLASLRGGERVSLGCGGGGTLAGGGDHPTDSGGGLGPVPGRARPQASHTAAAHGAAGHGADPQAAAAHGTAPHADVAGSSLAGQPASVGGVGASPGTVAGDGGSVVSPADPRSASASPAPLAPGHGGVEHGSTPLGATLGGGTPGGGGLGRAAGCSPVTSVTVVG